MATITGDPNAGWATAIGGAPDDGSLPKAAHIRAPVQAVLNDLARIGDRLGYNAGTGLAGTAVGDPNGWSATWYTSGSLVFASTGLTKTVSLEVNQLVHVTAEFDANMDAGVGAAQLYVDDGGGFVPVAAVVGYLETTKKHFSISYWYEAAVTANHIFELWAKSSTATPGNVQFDAHGRIHVQLFGKRFPNDGVPL